MSERPPPPEEIRIRRYEPPLRQEWDAFVAGSKNGTFLLQRNYLEYHADRFVDHSLLIYEGQDLVALLPANRVERVLESHGGLTYGGMITGDTMTTPGMLRALGASMRYLAREGFDRVLYKSIPHIYHRVPAEEDAYCLFRLGARNHRRDTLSVIDYRHPLRFQERRRRGIGKATRAGVEIRENQDYPSFWQILADNLRARYGRDPVHTLEEIQLLAARFPREIVLMGAYLGGKLCAGTVLYRSPQVCHVQYNAADERGRRVGALDYLFATAIASHRESVRYFDFGISTEDEGRRLNHGLVDYKEGFGARAVVHDAHELTLAGG